MLDTLGQMWSYMPDKGGWVEEAIGMMHCLIICAWLNEVRGSHSTTMHVICKSLNIIVNINF